MAKKNETKAVEETKVETEVEAEDGGEDTGVSVELDEATGLPITVDASGKFIPKIPKAFFNGEHVKVGKYESKLAFLEYYVKMVQWRLDQHKALKDPARAKAMKIAKMQAELARLMAEG